MKRKLIDWIIGLVVTRIQVGGWCGLCGNWIEHQLFPIACPYGVCNECPVKAYNEKEGNG